MAGIDGNGGSMDYEYDAPLHANSTIRSARVSRCPAMARYNGPPASHGPPAYDTWQTPPSVNSFTGHGLPHGFHSFGYSGNMPALNLSLPNPLPEPRPFHSTQPQEAASAGLPGNSRYIHVSRPSSDVDIPAPPSPPLLSTSANLHLSSISLDILARARDQSHPASGSPEADANSSHPLHLPEQGSHSEAQSQSQSTSLDPAQREGRSSSDHLFSFESMTRVQLPAPSNSRHGMSGGRSAAALDTLARYREVANYMGTAEYEAAHAVSTQTSDDDSDRETVARPYTLGAYGYLHAHRQSQILRGRMNGKRVASKKAVQSLEKLDVDDLQDTEKTCVICYNDFGVASPEGIVESPLRLPKCKHVFGNKCILKWLQESYSCPYCRDKLESEMARPDRETIRRMMADQELGALPASIRGLYRPDAAESLQRTRDRERALETSRDSTSRGERRAAPPEDSSDVQRRQRPRVSVDGYHNGAFTASTRNLSREHPPQRTPAWQQGTTLASHRPIFPHYNAGSAVVSPNTPQSRYQLPPFIMPTGYMHTSNTPSFPPMYSREDTYQGPSISDLQQMGASGNGPLAGQVHGNTNLLPGSPRSAPPPVRHLPPPSETFHYATLQSSILQSPDITTQHSRTDDFRERGSYSGSSTRN